MASIGTPGSGYTVGDVLTIPDGTLGTGSTGNTYTVDQVGPVYANAPAELPCWCVIRQWRTGSLVRSSCRRLNCHALARHRCLT